MQAKYYTLEQAKAALPQVKALMGRVQEARSEIMRFAAGSVACAAKGGQ